MKTRKLKVGDVVDYHSIIGGPITSYEHTIQHIGYIGRERCHNGTEVAWISDKTGCVALEALSLSAERFGCFGQVQVDEP